MPVTDEGAPGDRQAVITADRFQRDGPRAEDRGGCILGDPGLGQGDGSVQNYSMTAMCPGPVAPSPSSLWILLLHKS